jgi:hypothetical protein
MNCLASQRSFKRTQFKAKGFACGFGRLIVLRNNCAVAARAQKISSAIPCTIRQSSGWNTVDVSDKTKRESVTGQQIECTREEQSENAP